MTFYSKTNIFKKSTIPYRATIAAIVAVVAMLSAPQTAEAFPIDTYTTQSRLSQGRWVKIGVASSGLYLISTSNLKSWGFTDPSKVRIYGYGGQRLSDVLSLEKYIDDLPPVQSELTSQGIVFYASGVETWVEGSNGLFTHTLNPFSVKGYYFLTDTPIDGDEGATAIPRAGTPGASSPKTTFTSYLYHEKDLTKLGQTGHLLVGEDFKWSPTQNFDFTLTDLVPSEKVTLVYNFVARTLSGASSISLTANGQKLPSTASDNIRATANSAHNHGEMTTSTKQLELTEPRLRIGMTYSSPVPVNAAHLNYIEINYTRQLRLADGMLLFDLNSTQAQLAGAKASTRIWDVTNPLAIYAMNTASTADGVAWTNDYTGSRRYAAWDDNARFMTPSYEGTVANQNLHSPEEYPDMVIFTLPEWNSEAQRVAQLHRNSPDSLDVVVINQGLVFNEFASGVADVNAFRRYLKMVWDRGNEADKPLKYAMFMGKPTFDNRGLSATAQAAAYPTMPTWQSDTSLDDNTSFTTDDIFAFLRDGSGANINSDYLCIGVGRIPAKNIYDAKTAVDKLYEYVEKSSRTNWRNQVMLVADDGNNGIHMYQTEDFINGLMSAADGDQFFYTKVYIDAFDLGEGGYPAARQRMFTRLNEGTMWWNFVGHANPTSWTAENILNYNDINNLYVRNYPVLYAATCEFLNWDATSMSGAEILYFTRQGGIIAAITAARPVYITDNGLLGVAMAPNVFARDENGKFLTIGEIYRRGKNNIVDSKGKPIPNSNKLRYILMGDPAMRLISPENRIVLESINGEKVDPESQVTIMARQKVTIEGTICNPAAEPIPDFNGDITFDLYDAEHSTTSHGNNEGAQVTFEEQGSKLVSGRDHVTDGRFCITFNMPEGVADNFRPAALNMYAKADNGADAMGINRDFYVYGMDINALPDTIPPVIETLYLNHPTFADGGTVNSTPMLVATVSDDRGINISSSGVGRVMNIQLDGTRTFTDVSQSFTPDMGSLSGTIAYSIPELTDGHHTLRLRVWDTGGNVAEQTIECFVNAELAPELFDVYADRNPASVETSFFVTHDRPEAMLTVTVEVFNLMGQPVWSNTSSGRSDMFKSSPVTWDLTDMGGHRVNRGIYLYRARINTPSGDFVTKSSRIAVTAP